MNTTPYLYALVVAVLLAILISDYMDERYHRPKKPKRYRIAGVKTKKIKRKMPWN